MKKILFLIFLFYNSNFAQAKNIGIFLYTSENEGNIVYEKFTKNLNFDRKLKIYKKYDFEYHVTLAFIENVHFEDAKNLKSELNNLLKNDSKNIYFDYGISSILGKNVSYIVALPNNPEKFVDLNLKINNFLNNYKNGQYHTSEFTKNERYIPHLSLNGQLFEHVKIEDLVNILIDLNKNMSNYKIPLNKLVIKID